MDYFRIQQEEGDEYSCSDGLNIWKFSLPVDTDFSSLSGFIRHVNRMDLLEFRRTTRVAFNAVFTLSRLTHCPALLSFCIVTHCYCYTMSK